ncbi:hypothetical protein EYF80_037507 [Liparis tanakae]|uniref:Uncharacterized protein n=1 Tax=Liparis tanakae TaxID=230148 RepID=A0A4Z2GG65_9TELE|nr:hypothetical protein EYF80_037507 [Liparis tanakae]
MQGAAEHNELLYRHNQMIDHPITPCENRQLLPHPLGGLANQSAVIILDWTLSLRAEDTVSWLG